MNPRNEPITFRELVAAELFLVGGFGPIGSDALPLALSDTVRGCFEICRRS